MTTTDKIAFFYFLVYFVIGWRKGVWRALVGPVSFFISMALAYFYFSKTGKIFLSALFATIGPFVLHILFMALIGLWERANEKELQLTWMNRLMGSCVSLSWALGLLMTFMFIFVLVPPQLFGLEAAREDVVNSFTFNVVSKLSPVKMPRAEMDMASSQERLEEIKTTEEYEELMQDARVQSLLTDPQVQRDVQNRDIAQLLDNPKLYEIVKDKDLVLKFIKLQRKLMEDDITKPAAETEKTPDAL